MDNSDTLGILKKLEKGDITAAQADEQLNAPPPVERDYSPAPDRETGAPWWVRRLWFYPLTVGLLIVGLGVWMIVATMHANVLWFFCGLPILLFGALIVAISASAQSGHWLYVSVKASKRPRHIQVAVPFPLGLVRGGLKFARLFGVRPRAKWNVAHGQVNWNATWQDAEEMLVALERELREGRPVSVDVDEKNERVQVYIV